MGPAAAGEVTVLIADDEPLARRRVAELLRRRDDMRVVGQTATGPATLEAVRELEPDLLFLDVQMPGFTGFEVLARLDDEDRPAVVFSTAYDEYALAAFEVHAVDYLLKPYDDARFESALERAKGALRGERLDEFYERLEGLLETRPEQAGGVGRGAASEPRHRERFTVPSRGHLVVVDAADVDWIEASGDYVDLHVGREKHLLRATMTALEEGLDPANFLRIHRSTIVRLDRIRHLRTGAHGEYLVVLEGGRQLRVGPTYRQALLERLGMRW